MKREKIKRIYNRIVIKCFSKKSHYFSNSWSLMNNEGPIEIKGVAYRPCFENIKVLDVKHKWVGAQYCEGKVYAVPNSATVILVKEKEIEYITGIADGEFKWTGGCIWDEAIYCFPRSANSFLKIKGDYVEEINMSITYDKEHHYSGICTENGVVYQPPRNENHLLKTDLKSGISTKIYIVSNWFKVCFRYCGGIVHPNGYIYFFPEDGRVIKLDPKTDKWCFIGGKISTMCFDAKIGIDGNIYGYSAYQKGIMKIDVYQDLVEMIHQEIIPGAYGTKYGIDGCLYSVPGDGTKVWKYNVMDDQVEEFFDLQDNTKAKYAGGVTMPDGRIVCVPANAERILILKPDVSKEISKETYVKFYVDNY